MLDTLISNKTRLKLLLRFFLNPECKGYLRGLEGEFGESTNAIRLELNRFEKAGLLLSASDSNRKVFRANTGHPIFSDLNSILQKYIGIEKIVDHVIKCVGLVKRAYLAGEMARGLETPTLELVLVGTGIDKKFLQTCIRKVEKLMNRNIQCLILNEEQENHYLRDQKDLFLIWKNDGR
jgi:hypothetical protein